MKLINVRNLKMRVMLAFISLLVMACGSGGGSGGGSGNNQQVKASCVNDNTIVAFYNFDEAGGADVLDLSDNELHGVLEGSSRTAGQVGNALTIDSQGGKVEIDFMQYINTLVTGQISIEAWIRPDQLDVNATYHIIGNTSGGIQTFRFQIYQGKLEFLVSQNGWHRVILGNRTLSTGTWQHVAVTFTGSEAATYVNGVVDSTSQIGYKINDIYNSVTIGNSSYTDPFYGQIDEVKIYDQARSAAQISETYQKESQGGRSSSCISPLYHMPAGHGLLSDYRFEEAGGADILDSSGNGLHGVLVGASRAPGQVGNALTINSLGGKAEIDFMHYINTLVTGQISIEAWIRPDQLDANATYHIIGNTSGGIQTFRFQIYQGKLEFLVSQNGWHRVILGKQPLTAGTWQHVAVTFTGSEAATYVNGMADSSSVIGYKLYDIYNKVTIGNSSYTDPFYGQIDEVKIYDYSRTGIQVNQTYMAER